MFGRRPVVGEWKRMSPPQRVEWCEAKLNRIAELERQLDQDPRSPEYGEAMRNLASARRDIANVLNSLHGVRMPDEYLTSWGRLNRWVSDWAEADRKREQARGSRAFCWSCMGRGATIEGSYRFYFRTCGACGGAGRVDRGVRGY